MANVYVNSIGVPRKARNGKFYGGVSFSTTNPYQSQSDAPAQKHFESGRLTDLSSRNVIVYFTDVFLLSPIRINLSVYRMVQIGVGKYVYENVLYYHAALPEFNEYGFGLVIDDSESLTGVVVEYCFTE